MAGNGYHFWRVDNGQIQWYDLDILKFLELDQNGEASERIKIPSNIIFSKEWVDTGLIQQQEAPSVNAKFDFKSAVNIGVDLEIGEEFIPDADYGDLDVQSLLEFNFSEVDMKEAEEVDKYCNGSKGKFGKIKK